MTSTRRALVVIDVQQEYFEGPLMIEYPPRQNSLANIVRVIDTAAAHDIPVVVVRHEIAAGAPVFAQGSVGVQLHPQVALVDREDGVAHRKELLGGVGRDQLVNDSQ